LAKGPSGMLFPMPMSKFLICLVLCGLTLSSFAQPLTTTTPYDLTSTLGAPFSIPVRFDLTGRISFKFSADAATSFPLHVHGAWEWQNYRFVPAIVGMNEEWLPAELTTPLLRVRRQRVEGGAGAGHVFDLLGGHAGLAVSLVPFKGAQWESRTFRTPSKGIYSLPLSREDWDEWQLAEGRDYQVYGGLTFKAGLDGLGINFVQLVYTSQTRWSIFLEKLSPRYLRLRLRADDWKKRGRILGPVVASWESAALRYFDQERSYLVDMENPEAYLAIAALWAGRLEELQSSAAALEEVSARQWVGHYHQRYLGVPFVYGQAQARVSLEGIETGPEKREIRVLNIQTTNKGVLRESDPQVWTVLEDVDDEVLYFLALSQSKEEGSLGVKQRLGVWMERLGLLMDWPQLSKKDFLDARVMFAVSRQRFAGWLATEVDVEGYRQRCLSFRLTCQRLALAREAVARWNELRKAGSDRKELRLSEFLIRHPSFWAVLLAQKGEELTTEFMAHGERWLPVRRLVVTQTGPWRGPRP